MKFSYLFEAFGIPYLKMLNLSNSRRFIGELAWNAGDF